MVRVIYYSIHNRYNFNGTNEAEETADHTLLFSNFSFKYLRFCQILRFRPANHLPPCKTRAFIIHHPCPPHGLPRINVSVTTTTRLRAEPNPNSTPDNGTTGLRPPGTNITTSLIAHRSKARRIQTSFSATTTITAVMTPATMAAATNACRGLFRKWSFPCSPMRQQRLPSWEGGLPTLISFQRLEKQRRRRRLTAVTMTLSKGLTQPPSSSASKRESALLRLFAQRISTLPHHRRHR